MYSPKVKEELVVKLYRHKQNYPVNKPMTWFVNEAIQEYLHKNGGSDVTSKRMVLLGPKRNEQIFITDQLNQTKELKMGWERIIYTVAVMVAEEVLKHYITKAED